MQPFYKRFSVIYRISGFAAAFAGRTASSSDGSWQCRSRTRHGSRHTQEVLLQLSNTESLLKDAETGQRGYLYTRASARIWLLTTLAIKQIDPEMRSLAEMTADNPARTGQYFPASRAWPKQEAAGALRHALRFTRPAIRMAPARWC